MKNLRIVLTFTLQMAIVFSLNTGDHFVLKNFSFNYNEAFLRDSNLMYQMTDHDHLVLSGEVELIKGLPDDTMIDIKTYQHNGVGFSEQHDANYTESLCQLFARPLIFGGLFEHSNIPRDCCPLREMKVTVNDYDINPNDIGKFWTPGPSMRRLFISILSSETQGTILSTRADIEINVHRSGSV